MTITIDDDAMLVVRKTRNHYLSPSLTPTDDVDVSVDWNEEVEIQQRRYHSDIQSQILPRLKPRKHILSVMNMPLAFIDGEGANVPGPPVIIPAKKSNPDRTYTNQNYSYLNVYFETPPLPGASNYKYLDCKDGSNNGRLDSYSILKWIADLPPRYAYTAFYFSYDVEMWLRDLTWKERETLRDKGQIHWRGFFIKWIPGKQFRIIRDRVADSAREHNPGKDKEHIRNRERYWVKIWDMYGYFQMSFMRALREWKLGTPEELDLIQRGKDKRSDFSSVDDEVREYAYQEAKLGVALAGRIRDECKKLDLNLSGLHGAGTIADALFRKYGVGDYGESPEPPPLEIVCRSYFGGRFDTSQVGYVGTLHEYDINSAYPEQIRSLPCLAHTRWEWTRDYQEDLHSLWYVRWDLDASELWSPFPYRTGTGDIRYFRNGAGWYYGCEVQSARKLTKNLQVTQGYRCIRECSHRPFEWMEEIYSQRQALKQVGDLAEKILKLGMNSAYGKLAESKTNRPYYQNLLLAGIITAMTRAKLMEAVAQSPESVVILATDAVYSSKKLDLPLADNELGLWEMKTLEDVFVLQNGLYHSTSVDSKGRLLCDARRGFAEIDWSEARSKYSDGLSDILVPSTTFLTWDKASASPKTHNLVCNWVREYKRLSFDMALHIKDLRDGRLHPLDNDDAGPSHRKQFKTIVPIHPKLNLLEYPYSIDESLDLSEDDSITITLPSSLVVVDDD
jgi:hypothetical protein